MGLVRHVIEEQFQITDMGLVSLLVERKINNMQPALKPREDVEMCDRTVWEMLVLLMDQGWRAFPDPPTSPFFGHVDLHVLIFCDVAASRFFETCTNIRPDFL